MATVQAAVMLKKTPAILARMMRAAESDSCMAVCWREELLGYIIRILQLQDY